MAMEADFDDRGLALSFSENAPGWLGIINSDHSLCVGQKKQ